MKLTKAETLQHWQALPEMPVKIPDAIPYKHRGTTYGADGIRIEGSRDFIDSVLAQLKPLLTAENANTRIALNYQQVERREGKDNPFAGQWVCYIKVHERGSEAQAVNAFVSALRGRETIASRGY